MMNKKLLLFLLFPSMALAKSPDKLSLSLELGFLALLIIMLMKASFGIEKKAILFVAYIVLGILTKNLWIPILLTAGLFWYFHKNSSDQE